MKSLNSNERMCVALRKAIQTLDDIYQNAKANALDHIESPRMSMEWIEFAAKRLAQRNMLKDWLVEVQAKPNVRKAFKSGTE